jgi:hypothetical protein
MSHPLVVNLNRSKFDVYIGRPGKGYSESAAPWGNPYEVGVDGTRAEVIAMFRKYLERSPTLLARLPELRGKYLGCFCAPASCHGDVLAELANRGGEGQTSLFGGDEG